ncbi:MAG: hypothetical protein RIC55_21355 [Pirellulaceae bacterium]
MIKARKLRRSLDAAIRDRRPDRFWSDLREALDKKQLRPTDFSIRQLFEAFVEEGRELADSFSPRQGGGVALLEAAVDTSAFSNISGQVVFTAVMEAFESEAFVFSSLVQTIPTQFNGEKIPGVGRLGDVAEPIGEGAAYPQVGLNEDWIETPETTKRGFIVPVTKEAIFFDRTNLLLQRAAEVGEFLGLNKEKRVLDCVIDENAAEHRYKWRGTTYATYQSSAPWDNVTTANALDDWTSIDAAEQTLNGITDPNTGEPVLVTPTHLIVAPRNLHAARRIVSATEIQSSAGGDQTMVTRNPIDSYQIASSRLLASRMADDTDWFLGNPRKAFAYMQNWPVTVIQAPSNSEAEFTQDIVVRFKASERGAAATLEPRVMTRCTAA